MNTDTDSHLSTGAMALDSLPRDEAIDFVDHLATCSTCSAELAGFLETAALLGAAVAEQPPADLRRAVMDAIKRTPQLPPITGTQPDLAPLGRHRQSDSADSANVVPLRRPWYRRPQAYLAAAVAAVVIGGGTTLIVANSGGPGGPVASCISTASDRQTIAPKQGLGGVVYSSTCGQATVTAAGLPALPSDQVYQLWALKNLDLPTARSIGVMKVNGSGSPDATQAGLQSGETDMAISIEAAPGPAESPSKNIVWVAHL